MNDNNQASSAAVHSVTDAISRLDVAADMGLKVEPVMQQQPVSSAIDCKCGMPLCICEAPAPSGNAIPQQV